MNDEKAENPDGVIRNFERGGVMVTMASARSKEGSLLSEESETRRDKGKLNSTSVRHT
jgi:hypothetical protein